ncbi:MAG: pentapeptide repeat-containing protein [Oligoflexus sp.]
MRLRRPRYVIPVLALIHLACGRAGFQVVETDDPQLDNGSQLPIDSQDGDVIGDGTASEKPGDIDDDEPEAPPPPPPPPPTACEAYLELSCQKPHNSELVIGPQEYYQDLDLSAVDLVGEALYQSFWQRVKIERSCASQANLTQIVWSQVDGSHADFYLAVFFGAELSQSQFSFAHLRQATFNRSRLSDLSFGSACLNGAQFRETELRGSLDFTGVIAQKVDFYRSFFTGTASFEEADLQEANFSQSIFDKPVSFRRADLRRANFLDAEIANNIDFSEADLSGAIWVDGRTCAPDSIGECL